MRSWSALRRFSPPRPQSKRKMTVHVRRPRHQRHVRVLLGFALVIPAAGIVQAAGVSPLALAAVAVLLSAAVFSAYDAYRWVLVIHRYGVGVRQSVGIRVVWVTWRDIVEIDVVDDVLSLTTREPAVYQVQSGRRSAELVSRMVERALVA
jgi:hypothetical protein